MRFTTILVSVPVLAILATGLAIPIDVNVEARTLEDVRQAHRQTTHLPDRHSTFHIPGDPATGKPAHTYTGLGVRKAVYDGHKEADRLAQPGVGTNTQLKKSLLKTNFQNRPHRVAHPSGTGGDRPLPDMTVTGDPDHPLGREFPLPNKHVPSNPKNTGPARVITQQVGGPESPDGHHQFQGVISHDQSRTDRTTGAGYNDHFQVHEQRRTLDEHGWLHESLNFPS